jgi:MFS family permease
VYLGQLKLELPSLSQFNRDAKLLFVATGIVSGALFGIQKLLEVLYVLRLGYGSEYMGMFVASGAFAFTGASLPAGALGRRFGTQHVMLLGGIGIVLGMASMPLTEFVFPGARHFWPIGSRILIHSGWSMFNINLVPALAAATSVDSRNDAYAVNGVLRGLGILLGSLVAGILPGLFARALHVSLEVPGPYRLALWVGAALALIGLMPLSLVEASQPGVPRERKRNRDHFPVGLMALMMLYACVYNGGLAAWQGFSSAYMDSELDLPISAIGMIAGAAQLGVILAPLIIAGPGYRRRNGWILFVTSLVTGVSLALVGLIHHWAAAGQACVSTLTLAAIWIPALAAFQMEMVDSEWWSLAYGAVSMAMGLGFGIAAVLGGHIIAALGYSSLFLMGAGVSVVSAMPMWGVLRAMRAGHPDPA